MRHAISVVFKAELESNNTEFSFKPCPYNPTDYIELASWPENMSAQEAKEQLISRGVTVVTLDPDSVVVDELEIDAV